MCSSSDISSSSLFTAEASSYWEAVVAMLTKMISVDSST